MSSTPEFDFITLHKQDMESSGFWLEEYKSGLLKNIESRYATDVIRHWHICDIVINGDKVLLKMKKRFIALTDDQLKDDYGRPRHETLR